MHQALKLVLWGVLTVAASAAGQETNQPWASHDLTFETGVLWEIGSLTTIPYRLVPSQVSWRSADIFGWTYDNGARLVVRHRLTLIGTWVQNGPESRYFGVAGSPSIELWNPAGTRSLYFGSGGGFGFADSRNIPGGLGQNFTFNWFIRSGAEFVTARHAHLNVGIMYQHMSNGGQTDPNPGIDALGLTLGYGWAF
jgi:lipid A 3-O-deacylase